MFDKIKIMNTDGFLNYVIFYLISLIIESVSILPESFPQWISVNWQNKMVWSNISFSRPSWRKRNKVVLLLRLCFIKRCTNNIKWVVLPNIYCPRLAQGIKKVFNFVRTWFFRSTLHMQTLAYHIKVCFVWRRITVELVQTKLSYFSRQ